MKTTSDAVVDKLPDQHVSPLKVVLSVIGVAASMFFLYCFHVYINVDGVHPFNIVLYHLGAASIVGLDISDFMEFNIFDIIPLTISFVSAILFCFGLAAICARPAYKIISAYAR